MVRLSVSLADLATVRRVVREAGHRVGLSTDRSARFQLAVHEIVINSIEHGGGHADVSVTTDGDRIVVVVQDQGAGLPADLPTDLPPAAQVGGRGLWLARHNCDDLKIQTTSPGSRIQLGIAAG